MVSFFFPAFYNVLLLLTGFDVGVNKQLMNELSGLDLGPPRLPVMTCPAAHALAIKQKYDSIFPE